ncbi:MAG: hypothetical protein Q7J42_06165 [Sulfuritalea sp.]|nr:hypothetical protein [Sulfuritalea sp.]
MSARTKPRDVEKGIAACFRRYLTKPINVIEFMDALDARLRCDGQEIPLPLSPEQAFRLM